MHVVDQCEFPRYSLGWLNGCSCAFRLSYRLPSGVRNSQGRVALYHAEAMCFDFADECTCRVMCYMNMKLHRCMLERMTFVGKV